MKKTIPFITIISLLISSCHAQTNSEVKQTSHSKPSVTSNWKTYANEKMGITFQYPDTWTIYGKESNIINRNGGIMAISVSFTDTTTQSIFFIEYHVAPYGAELFKYSKAQFDSTQGAYLADAKQIKVAGNNALEAFTTKSKDIKGNIYNPPLRIISIVFLDKQQTGDFELHFSTPFPNKDIEVAKFKQLLSTLKFIK